MTQAAQQQAAAAAGSDRICGTNRARVARDRQNARRDRRSAAPGALLRAGLGDAAARAAARATPGTAPTSSAAACATRSSTATTTTPTSTSRPTPGPTRSSAIVKGWADAVWLQGERFGTVGCEKDGERFEITTFRAESTAPRAASPRSTFSDDIETDLSRRDFTVNAMALALDEPELVDPLRRPRRPRGPAAAHAAVARGLVRRRPAAHAARGPLRRDARLRARRRAARGDRADARAARDHQRRAHPRRAVEAAASPTIRRPGSG